MSEKQASKLPAKAKQSLNIKATLTANFDHVVTAKVGRLELRLNQAITTTTNDITVLRKKISDEADAIAAWAKKTFVNTKLLSEVPSVLELKLSFSTVSVKLNKQVSTAHWSLMAKNAGSHSNDVSLKSYEKEIPADETEKYFSLVDQLSTAESNLLALRRELSQLDSKTRILRGAAAEAQLREQGCSGLLDSINDTDILSLPDNVAALLAPEKLIGPSE